MDSFAARLRNYVFRAMGLTKGAGFRNSADYWERRYQSGRDSGPGSYDHFASYKASFLNKFIAENLIESVVEFGVGDGNQLRLGKYPRYLGIDVSETIVQRCRRVFCEDSTKQFATTRDFPGGLFDLSLSLDVIYHLVEDEVFHAYMKDLFDSSSKFVIIYSSDTDDDLGIADPHVKHRKFSKWVEDNRRDWALQLHEPNPYPYNKETKEGTFADFFVYGKVAT